MRDWIFRSSRKVFLSNWKYRKVLPLKQCYVHQGVRWLETSKITITLVTLPRVELRHHHNRSKNDNPLHTNRRAKKGMPRLLCRPETTLFIQWIPYREPNLSTSKINDRECNFWFENYLQPWSVQSDLFACEGQILNQKPSLRRFQTA